MGSARGDALYVYWCPSGILAARASSFGQNPTVGEIYSVSCFDKTPREAIETLGASIPDKKGFWESVWLISSDAFFHFPHVVENLGKTKEPDYFAEVLRMKLSQKNPDVFYHLLSSETGDVLDLETFAEKNTLISGIEIPSLKEIQENILGGEFFPRKVECSTLCMIHGLKSQRVSENQDSPIFLLELYDETSLLTIIPHEGAPSFHVLNTGEIEIAEKVKSELSLKDVNSARKLLHSSTIDLSDIGREAIYPLYKEVSATIGLFEVETGLSSGKLFIGNAAESMNWMEEILCSDLGMEPFDTSGETWLKNSNVSIDQSVKWNQSDRRYSVLLTLVNGSR